VDEAAAVLRVGRTKAYRMTRDWRTSGGRSGLPVVDFGHVLRVPRRALEQVIGFELTVVPDPDPDHSADPAAPPPSPDPVKPARQRRSRRARRSSQLDLFEPSGA